MHRLSDNERKTYMKNQQQPYIDGRNIKLPKSVVVTSRHSCGRLPDVVSNYNSL